MVTRNPAPASTAAAPVMVISTATGRGRPSFCSQYRIGSDSTVTNTATRNGMRMASAARRPAMKITSAAAGSRMRRWEPAGIGNLVMRLHRSAAADVARLRAWTFSGAGAPVILDQLLHHRRLGQRGDVSEVGVLA